MWLLIHHPIWKFFFAFLTEGWCETEHSSGPQWASSVKTDLCNLGARMIKTARNSSPFCVHAPLKCDSAFLAKSKAPFPHPSPPRTCGLLWSGDQKIDMKRFWTKVFWDLTTPIRPSFRETMSVHGEALNQGIHRPSASSTQANGLIFFRQLSLSCHQTSEGAWMTCNKTNRRTFCWAIHSANCRDNLCSTYAHRIVETKMCVKPLSLSGVPPQSAVLVDAHVCV